MPPAEACDQDQTCTLDWNARLTPRSSIDEAHAALWTTIVGAAKHLAKRQPLPTAQRPTVVQLKPGTAETPVYFLGAGLFEFHVAQLMPSQHPVFAVEIPWPAQWHDAAAKNDVRASPTLQQMVAPYVAALHAHAGSAPCVIAGYSFHGSMAFEAARQLHARGGKVELVMLLDAPAEYPPAHRLAWRKLQEVWRGAPELAPVGDPAPSAAARLKCTSAILRWTVRELRKNLKAGFLLWAMGDPGTLTMKVDTLGRPLHWRLVERVYANSLRSYRLLANDCRGVLFRADRAEDCPGGTADYSLGWSGLFSKGLDVIQVSGDHNSMMREAPHNRNLAREMSEVLERCLAKPPQRAPSAAAPER